jgi:septal ring factor EnvC (AmiA/AmiB activator)
MARGIRYLAVVLLSFVFVVSLFISGCTRYANEEKLNTLDETVAAADNAEQTVADKEKEKAELEAKLAERQAELEKVKANRAEIEQRLAE